MAKKKLQHFAEMKTFDCVFQPTNEEMVSDDFHLKGKWHADFFKNDNPITLELGCGKGEYTVGLARRYPKRNFIGVDIKGARLWRGAKDADTENLNNVAFIRTKIEFIHNFFAENEVEEIWFTFSDPQLKDKRGSKRLTSPHFLKKYREFLSPEGILHLKTDSEFLYQYTRELAEKEKQRILTETEDLYGEGIQELEPADQEILSMHTFYEKKFLVKGQPIHYLKYQLS